MAAMPDGRSLVDDYKGKPFVALGVNTDAPSDDLADRTKKARVPWRSFADGAPDGPISKAWSVRAFPTTFLLDHEGVVQAVNEHGDALRKTIDELLARVPSPPAADDLPQDL